MPHNILVADGFDSELFKSLCTTKDFNVHPQAKVKQEELPTLLKEVDAVVIRSATTIEEKLLEFAPNLKLVIRAGEGTDNIDKKLCANKNIKVENTPGANNNSAAEHAIALMMTVLRKTSAAHSKMQAGGWDKNLYMGTELWKKKVGVIGFGRIGQIVAKRLIGFETDTMFFDPFIESSDIPGTRKVASLEEIFSQADVITMHTPLLDATRNMITKDLLSKMPSHAILVNASRGGIVNQADMTEILKSQSIRGAGIDVFEKEPLDEKNELRSLENVVLTPHLGASTEEAQVRVGEMVIHQLKEFFHNNQVVNEVKA